MDSFLFVSGIWGLRAVYVTLELSSGVLWSEVSVVKGQHFILHWIKLCFQMQNVKVEVGQNKTVWTWNRHGSPKTWGFLPSHYHRLVFFFLLAFSLFTFYSFFSCLYWDFRPLCCKTLLTLACSLWGFWALLAPFTEIKSDSSGAPCALWSFQPAAQGSISNTSRPAPFCCISQSSILCC